ncbi:MAG: helicase SNF2 [Armatimonadetes bacterium CG07_land_8_20_14_0_80_40_9]|nr:MAG: helicase SNF2 [Armatimonadetes bacterium CG07_land_8_20_14_0_80_40_9]
MKRAKFYEEEDESQVNRYKEEEDYRLESVRKLYESYVRKGISFLKKGEINSAESLFKKAINLNFLIPDAHFQLGRLLIKKGNIKAAKNSLKNALNGVIFLKQEYPGHIRDDEIKVIEEGLEYVQERIRLLKEEKKLGKDIVDEDKIYIPPVRVQYEFDKENVNLIRQAEELNYESLKFYDLNSQAQNLSILQGFDELLSLSSSNIEHYQYQINTARKVLKRFSGRAFLCDEVGLGKTIEAGIILKEYILRGFVSKILILTVPSLVSQWKEEMSNKFGLNFITTDNGVFEEEKENFWVKNNFVIASLHTAKRKNNCSIIQDINYDILIVDEAHHLKSKNTLNYKLVNSIKSKFTLLLTATPIQNNLEEIFNLITLLKPGHLKTLSHFKKEFRIKGDPRSLKNKEKLRELLSECLIRNTRAEVDIKLPKRHAETIRINLSDDEKNFYNLITNFVKEEFYKSTQARKFFLETLQREASSSVNACLKTLKIYLGNNEHKISKNLIDFAKENREIGSAKLKILLKILNSTDEKFLIFTQFLETQSLVLNFLKSNNIPCSVFNGNLSGLEKDFNIQEFKEHNKVLISTEVGGEGRNLQFCNAMVNFDLPWNPMRIEQRVGRIHRVGQTREVYIFNLSYKDTIEDYILKLLDEKINMFELVIGEMGMILGNLEDIEFDKRIFEIWIDSKTKEDLNKKIEKFGERLLWAKGKHEEIKKLDLEIFGGDYET